MTTLIKNWYLGTLHGSVHNDLEPAKRADKRKFGRKMKMYGLFSNTYDWFEWRRLVAVSGTVEKLKIRYEQERSQELSSAGLLSGTEQAEAHDKEMDHYMIEEVEYI